MLLRLEILKDSSRFLGLRGHLEIGRHSLFMARGRVQGTPLKALLDQNIRGAYQKSLGKWLTRTPLGEKKLATVTTSVRVRKTQMPLRDSITSTNMILDQSTKILIENCMRALRLRQSLLSASESTGGIRRTQTNISHQSKQPS